MPGFLVYRPTATDRNMVSNKVGGFLVNGADDAEAVANASALIEKMSNPNDAFIVRSSWKAVQLGTHAQVSQVDIHDGDEGGSITVTVSGEESADIPLDSTAAEVAAAINVAVRDVVAPDAFVSVTKGVGSGGTGFDYLWTISMKGFLAINDVTVTIDDTNVGASGTADLTTVFRYQEAPDFSDFVNNTVLMGDVVLPGYPAKIYR